MTVNTTLKVAFIMVVGVSAFFYFSAQSTKPDENATALDKPERDVLESQLSSSNTTNSQVITPNPQTRVDVNRDGRKVLTLAAPQKNSREAPQGSKVKRHLGEPLDPETYIPEGAPELIAIGPALNPDKVYANSGAKKLKLVGEKIGDVDAFQSTGASEPQFVGEPIASEDVYNRR